MRLVVTSAAIALILAAGGVSADPGKNKGNDAAGAKGAHGKQAHENPGPGASAKEDRADKSQSRASAGNAKPSYAQSENLRHPGKSASGDARPSGQHQEFAKGLGQGNDKDTGKGKDKDKGDANAYARGHDKAAQGIRYTTGHGTFHVPADERFRVVTARSGYDWGIINRRTGLIDGCPPGLAKKYNGCTPPGLDRRPDYSWYRPDWYFNRWDRNYRYQYRDGYMLRLGSGGGILGYVPLLGGALSPGSVWPVTYAPASLPPYYVDYYGLGPVNSYRFYDDVIYRVDPQTAEIRSVAALLTGQDIAIGSPMPAGYEIYNVPEPYRGRYHDGPDAIYRFSDGHIYQLDPATRLVQAAIELLL